MAVPGGVVGWPLEVSTRTRWPVAPVDDAARLQTDSLASGQPLSRHRVVDSAGKPCSPEQLARVEGRVYQQLSLVAQIFLDRM